MQIWLCIALHLSVQLLGAESQCPAPYWVEAGKCIFVSTPQSHSWCSANRLCSSMGGELINVYSSLQQLANMPSVYCNCKLWLGLTDLSDERENDRSGWFMLNGNGILRLNNSMWFSGMPNNNGNQDCLTQSSIDFKFIDLSCSSKRGFLCEFSEMAANPQQTTSSQWQLTQFKRSSYNPSTEYCYTDVKARTTMKCVAAAMRAGSTSKHVLFNRKLKLCRLLEFTDAQVEEEIETSADWVKYKLV